MKRVISLFLCVALCFSVFAGCSNNGSPSSPESEPSAPSEGTEPSPSSTEKIELTLGHIYSSTHNEAVALEKLKEQLYDASEGRIELTIFPSSQLGSEREMAEQVVLGTLDMGLSDGPTWSNALQVPEVAVFGLPFLYKDIDGQKNVIDNILIEVSSKMMLPAGARPLFGFSASIRGALLNTKPILKADDIVGIKMRVPEITMYVDTWRHLGANPTTTPWGEAYTSIQQGVVDGCEADPSTLYDANLHETTKYFSKTNHIGTIHIISINEEKWQTIPEDLQNIIIEQAAIASAEQIEDRKRTDEASLQKMIEEGGITVNDIPSEEIEKMAEKCQPIYDKFAQEYDLGDVIEQLRELGM